MICPCLLIFQIRHIESKIKTRRNLHARFFARVIGEPCLSRLLMRYVNGEIRLLDS